MRRHIQSSFWDDSHDKYDVGGFKSDDAFLTVSLNSAQDDNVDNDPDKPPPLLLGPPSTVLGPQDEGLEGEIASNESLFQPPEELGNNNDRWPVPNGRSITHHLIDDTELCARYHIYHLIPCLYLFLWHSSFWIPFLFLVSFLFVLLICSDGPV